MLWVWEGWVYYKLHLQVTAWHALPSNQGYAKPKLFVWRWRQIVTLLSYLTFLSAFSVYVSTHFQCLVVYVLIFIKWPPVPVTANNILGDNSTFLVERKRKFRCEVDVNWNPSNIELSPDNEVIDLFLRCILVSCISYYRSTLHVQHCCSCYCCHHCCRSTGLLLPDGPPETPPEKFAHSFNWVYT